MSKPARERRRERRREIHEPRFPAAVDRLGLGRELCARLSFAIHSDYLRPIVEAVLDEVTEDVQRTSSYETDGVWNANDERLALGRVLCRRLGIEV